MADLQMSFFGFGKSAEVSIVLKDIDNRKRISHRISDRSKFQTQPKTVPKNVLVSHYYY